MRLDRVRERRNAETENRRDPETSKKSGFELSGNMIAFSRCYTKGLFIGLYQSRLYFEVTNSPFKKKKRLFSSTFVGGRTHSQIKGDKIHV